jgi:SAM-dependent methyltransferase
VNSADKPIRTTAQPRCSVCSSDGGLLYKGQKDRLFHASGAWDTFRCASAACDAVWLNPTPLVEDLPLAYEDYYTHQPERAESRTSRAKAVYRWLKLGYLSRKYGYGGLRVGPSQRLLGALLYLIPLRRAAVDEEVRQLKANPGGLLLDVGCGSGDWLVQMRELGWAVQGLDFDDKAVAAARDRGLAISSGSLESQRYPSAHFDVVTLNHVVEHLPDALATLSECYRILKPGGILVLYTPNSVSLGHAVFRSHWRGLEPPRHLHIFGPLSLGTLLHQAGFQDCRITTANSEFYWRQSLSLLLRSTRSNSLERGSNSVWARGLSLGLAALAQTVRPFNDQRGESLVAHATRN